MKYRNRAGLALGAMAALSLAAGAGATAPPAGDPMKDPELLDLMCFSAFGSPPDEADAEVKRGFELISLFFAGKLYGRNPQFSMKAAALRHGLTIDMMDMKAQMQRCLDEFSAAGEDMGKVGDGQAAG